MHSQGINRQLNEITEKTEVQHEIESILIMYFYYSKTARS